MADKLDYATRATLTTHRSPRERLVDVLVGSGLIFSGLFFTVFLSVATEGLESQVDEIFERPRNRVRRGFVRITKGREAARNYRP